MKGFSDLKYILPLALVYFLTANVGLSLAFVHTSVSSICPASGLGLAALLLLGVKAWPGILIGSFLMYFQVSFSGSTPFPSALFSALGISVGDTLEALVGAYLLNRFANGPKAFFRFRNYLKFILFTCFVSTLISGSISVTTMAASGLIPWADFFPVSLTWWLGDVAGILAVTPFLVLWIQPVDFQLLRRNSIEIFFLLLSSILVTHVVFVSESWKNLPLAFTVLPIVVWASSRFKQRGASFVIFLLSAMATYGTLMNRGPFGLKDNFSASTLLQIFMIVIAVSANVLACAVAEKEQANNELQSAHDELEGRVRQRTRELTSLNEMLRIEILDRKLTEKELRERENQLDEAQKIAGLGSWEWDLIADRFECSKGFLSIYMIHPDTYIGSYDYFLQFMNENDRKNFKQTIDTALHDFQPFCFEHEVVLGDGTVKTLWGAGKVLKDEFNRPLKVIATEQDATEQKKSQKLIIEKEKELREYIDHMSTLNMKVAPDGRLLLFNRIAELTSGLTQEKLMRINFLELPWWSFDPNVQSRVKNAFQRANSGQTVNYDEKLLVLGKVITINFSLVPVTSKHGKVSYILAEGRDITALKLAEEALQKTRDELEIRVQERTAELTHANTVLRKEITQRRRVEEELATQARELVRSNDELEQFAYIASHDLQEPLRMVASYVQLLQTRYRNLLDAKANEFIAFAVDGATRMQSLINDLLNYSRLGSLTQPFELQSCEVIFERAMNNLKIAIQESGAVITHDPLPYVIGDATQLVELFQNLVGNALKFKSGGTPAIHVSAKLDGKEWCFSVRDNGIGIDSRFKDKLFVIFQRLHNKDEYPGNGIGLAFCKKIVERHSGRIWFESEVGKGSTFYFTLPINKSKGTKSEVKNEVSSNTGV